MSWFSNFINGKNPANAGNKYISQIPSQTQGHYQPWEDAGKNMLPQLQDQYGQLMNDPGGKYNQIGESFHQSPGFKFAMEQALNATGNNAAAGGMAGSPAHMQGNQEMATNLANQDYYNYMGGATDLYKQGLNGGQTMSNQGQQAGQSQADMIAQTLAQQGNMAFNEQQQKNQNRSDMFGNIAQGFGGLGSFIPYGQDKNLGQMAWDKIFSH